MYLYGLLEPGHPVDLAALAALEGVTGPIGVMDLSTALLVYGPAASGDILPRRRLMLAHARVLETLTGQGAVLPMRFGMRADIAAVTSVLSAQAAQISAEFDTVRGCAEFGIRVSFPREPALSATIAQDPALDAERARLTGRGAAARMETAEFGRMLAERLDRRRAASQRALLAVLAPELAGHILRSPEEDVQVLAIDALVHQTCAEGLAARVEDLARTSAFAPGAEPRVKVVGPGPAYSFVRLKLETARWAA
jgi:hypothetical protein